MIKYINLKKMFEGVLSSSMKNGNKMGTLVPKGLKTIGSDIFILFHSKYHITKSSLI